MCLYESLPEDELVIVTAPSNAAIDIIVKFLVRHVPKEELCRLSSVSKANNFDKDIERVSTPDVKDVIKKKRNGLRILCGTLGIMGKLSKHKVQFQASHVFVDEAGQATIPDILAVWTQFLR